MDLFQVRQEPEGSLVTEGNEVETVVSESAHGSNGGRLLTTTQGTRGDEQTGILAPVAAGGPDAAGLVPEGLPLGREVAEAGGDAEEDGVVLEQVSRLSNGVRGLGRGVHLAEDVGGEGFGDPGVLISMNGMDNSRLNDNEGGSLEDIGLAACGFDTLLLGLGQLGDVAVHGVLDMVSGVFPGRHVGGHMRGGAHTKTIATLGAIVIK